MAKVGLHSQDSSSKPAPDILGPHNAKHERSHLPEAVAHWRAGGIDNDLAASGKQPSRIYDKMG
jgi:hypothetical protein